MDLNEFLVINTKTKLNDLDIMINELNILILLCQKTLSLKNLGIKNSQYERELLDFIKFKAGTVNIGKFINSGGEISLIEFSANRPFLSDDDINQKLLIIFSCDQKYWNSERQEKFKAKILIISKHINRLRNDLIQLFLV
jgi:hypothetical protein